MSRISDEQKEMKRWLRQARKLRIEEKSIRDALATLEARKYSPRRQLMTSGSGAGAQDMLGILLVKEQELISRYNELLAFNLKSQDEIESLIQYLESPIERSLIRAHYIEGKPWETTAECIGYSWSQTHRIHASALDNLVDIKRRRGLYDPKEHSYTAND